MRALLEFIAKYYHWMIFIVLEGLSLMLLFQFNRYQNSVWLTTANQVVGQVDAWEQEALRYVTLGRVNEDLTRRNLILEYNYSQVSSQLAELTHDSTVTERLQADRIEGIKLIPAKVVTNSIVRRNNLITISAGSLDGVKPEMGVVCGTGIVGIVYITSEHYSIVLPLLNSRSRISCRLRDSQFFGYLTWDGGSPLYVQLDDIPRHARFKIGDIVETSGFSSVFPPGLFVGKVDAVGNSDDGLSYKLRVHLAMDFSHLQDVYVIAQQFQPEVRELEQKADSLMKQ
ncbi:MAG: rod shape-determining protein MreC [Bacteroidaceae bacterium]|nr:rod shape-determining protein MreC [Bacteroidaceae bacterium]MBR0432967.1 rod shape-determining protein MreC [Bacteroidaceae bacterium]